jgi:hypothetical protein
VPQIKVKLATGDGQLRTVTIPLENSCAETIFAAVDLSARPRRATTKKLGSMSLPQMLHGRLKAGDLGHIDISAST